VRNIWEMNKNKGMNYEKWHIFFVKSKKSCIFAAETGFTETTIEI